MRELTHTPNIELLSNDQQKSILREYMGYHDRIDHDDDGIPILILNHTEIGDYTGSLLGLSNYEILDQLFGDNDWIRHIWGHYGYQSLAVTCEAMADKNFVEAICSLEQYPSLCDDHFSNLEFEKYSEDWNDYGSGDFINELTLKFKLSETTADFLENLDSDILREFYEDLNPCGDYYWGETGYSLYINIGSSVAKCTRKKLAQFIRANR